MQKLLNDYRATPTLKVAQKLRAYTYKHPFAACLMTQADTDLLVAAHNHANQGGR